VSQWQKCEWNSRVLATKAQFSDPWPHCHAQSHTTKRPCQHGFLLPMAGPHGTMLRDPNWFWTNQLSYHPDKLRWEGFNKASEVFGQRICTAPRTLSTVQFPFNQQVPHLNKRRLLNRQTGHENEKDSGNKICFKKNGLQKRQSQSYFPVTWQKKLKHTLKLIKSCFGNE